MYSCRVHIEYCYFAKPMIFDSTDAVVGYVLCTAYIICSRMWQTLAMSCCACVRVCLLCQSTTPIILSVCIQYHIACSAASSFAHCSCHFHLTRRQAFAIIIIPFACQRRHSTPGPPGSRLSFGQSSAAIALSLQRYTCGARSPRIWG